MSQAVVAVQQYALGTAPMDLVPVAVCESAPAPAVMLQMVPSLALDPRLRRQMGQMGQNSVNRRINGINY